MSGKKPGAQKAMGSIRLLDQNLSVPPLLYHHLYKPNHQSVAKENHAVHHLYLQFHLLGLPPGRRTDVARISAWISATPAKRTTILLSSAIAIANTNIPRDQDQNLTSVLNGLQLHHGHRISTWIIGPLYIKMFVYLIPSTFHLLHLLHHCSKLLCVLNYSHHRFEIGHQ